MAEKYITGTTFLALFLFYAGVIYMCNATRDKYLAPEIEIECTEEETDLSQN